MTDYRGLLVWQQAMLLAEMVYRNTDGFPRGEEFGLKVQMRRAAVSIPSNVAEGHTRRHSKEFIQFLCIALGSLAELETQLELARRFKFIPSAESQTLSDSCGEVGRMLQGLRKAITRYHSS
jgi:four helix bundle protein